MFSVCLFTGGAPPQLGGRPRGTPQLGGGAPGVPPNWGGAPGVPPQLGGGPPGGTPPQLGGRPRGYPPTGGGAPRGYPPPPPQLGGGTPGYPPPINLDKNVGQNLGQKMDKVLDKKWTKFWTKNWTNILETFGGGGRGRYASCGHAGGLSCCPGAVMIVGILVLLTLIPQRIGSLRKFRGLYSAKIDKYWFKAHDNLKTDAVVSVEKLLGGRCKLIIRVPTRPGKP